MEQYQRYMRKEFVLAKYAGMKVMEMVEKDIKPSDILTEKAFENALTVDMALGCSTNSILHLPAIANEAGVEINLDIVNEISSKDPNLCKLAPAGASPCSRPCMQAGGFKL